VRLSFLLGSGKACCYAHIWDGFFLLFFLFDQQAHDVMAFQWCLVIWDIHITHHPLSYSYIFVLISFILFAMSSHLLFFFFIHVLRKRFIYKDIRNMMLQTSHDNSITNYQTRNFIAFFCGVIYAHSQDYL
jgi:hypothetical protein